MKLRTNNIFPRQLPRNIILGLYDVLIPYSPQQFEDELREKLGEKPYLKFRRKAASSKLFEQLDLGERMPFEAREFFNKSGTSFGAYEFDVMFNASLGIVNGKNMTILRKLKKYHHTFLLANTNLIHMAGILVNLQNMYTYSSFDWLFEEVYLSYERGVAKPDPNAFLQIIEEHNLDPEQTLVIDSVAEHIVAAERLGLQTFHLRTDLGQTFQDYFPNWV